MPFDPISQDYHFKTWHTVHHRSPLKQNERVLSSQALNVGRRLGQSWVFEHGEIYFQLSCSGIPRL